MVLGPMMKGDLKRGSLCFKVAGWRRRFGRGVVWVEEVSFCSWGVWLWGGADWVMRD